MSPQLGRNAPCHCKSGKKYKRCCLRKDQAARCDKQARRAENEQARLMRIWSLRRPDLVKGIGVRGFEKSSRKEEG